MEATIPVQRAASHIQALGNRPMRLPKIGTATIKAIRAIDRKHLLAFAGSLAYYYFLSLLPLLILLASVLAYIPIPNLFSQILVWMSYLVPPDSMILVKKVLADIMGTRSSGFLSIGVLGTIWAASGASQ